MGLSKEMREFLLQVIGRDALICLDDTTTYATDSSGTAKPVTECNPNWEHLMSTNEVCTGPAYEVDLAVPWKANTEAAKSYGYMNGTTLEKLAQMIYTYSEWDQSVNKPDRARTKSIRHLLSISPCVIVTNDDRDNVTSLKKATQDSRKESSDTFHNNRGVAKAVPYSSKAVFRKWDGDQGTTIDDGGSRMSLDLSRLAATYHLSCAFWKLLPSLLEEIVQEDELLPHGNVLLVEYDHTGPWQIAKGSDFIHRTDLAHVYGEGELAMAHWSRQLCTIKGMDQLSDPIEGLGVLPQTDEPLNLCIDTTDSDVLALYLEYPHEQFPLDKRVYWLRKQIPFNQAAGSKRKKTDSPMPVPEPKLPAGGTHRTSAGFQLTVAAHNEPLSWTHVAVDLRKLRSNLIEYLQIKGWGGRAGAMERFKLCMAMLGGDYVDTDHMFFGLTRIKLIEAFSTYTPRGRKPFEMALNASESKETEEQSMASKLRHDRSELKQEMAHILEHVYRRVITGAGPADTLGTLRTKSKAVVAGDRELEHIADMVEFQRVYWQKAVHGKSWREAAQHMFVDKEGEKAYMQELQAFVQSKIDAKAAKREMKNAAH